MARPAKLNESGIEELFREPEGPVARIMETFAYRTENTAKVLVSAVGAGRVYDQFVWTRKPGAAPGTPGRLGFGPHGSRPSHQASAPGQPPSSDTGFLRNTIGHQMLGDNTAMVYAAAPYSSYLELGTRYMAPRPFLRPALAAAMKEGPVRA